MKQAFIFLFTLLVIFNLYGHNKDNISWWLYNHGDYTKTEGKNDPNVKRALKVFERVENAADKTGKRPPRLFIIKTRRKLYAQALPDGGIIITPTTLDICYKNVTCKEGDRRLAFILGHELAHLANDDFMHWEAFTAMEEHSDKHTQHQLKKTFKLPERKTKELMADEKGTLYAAMAGYDIGGLFGKKNNFLYYWAWQTGIDYLKDDIYHPAMDERVKFVCAQLLDVVEKLDLFRAGVLLYQVENYHDAIAAFREFAKVYPAREVLNNTGACHLNLALHHIYLKFKEEYYRFRLSTAVDYTTTAEGFSPRGEGDYSKDKEISRHLKKAEGYFRRAAARDQHDRACRYNLAAALILKKEFAEALAVCNKILKIDSQDINALNNKSIAFYYYGKEEDLDTTQKAILVLEKAHRLKPDNFEVLYNLAALKQERKRMAGAKVYWEKYLKLPTTPKDNFYKYVSEKLKESKGIPPPKPKEKAETPTMPDGISLREDFSLINELES